MFDVISLFSLLPLETGPGHQGNLPSRDLTLCIVLTSKVIRIELEMKWDCGSVLIGYMSNDENSNIFSKSQPSRMDGSGCVGVRWLLTLNDVCSSEVTVQSKAGTLHVVLWVAERGRKWGGESGARRSSVVIETQAPRCENEVWSVLPTAANSVTHMMFPCLQQAVCLCVYVP